MNKKSLLRKVLEFTHRPLIILHKSHGLERVPKGPFILIANHPHWFDGPVLYTTFFYRLGHDVKFLAAQSTYSNKMFRFYYKVFEIVMVEEKSGKSAFNEALSLLKSGSSVGIFPEGKSTPIKAKKAKTGAVRLSLLTGAPIVPVKIVKKKRWHLFVGKPYFPKKISISDWAAVRKESSMLLDHVYSIA
jgi:1-acyl-sn-glycerol-3-phosphate acyltransferase